MKGFLRRLGWFVIAAGVLPGVSDLRAQMPEVFLPGVVTIEGDNVYRGTFRPDDGSFWFFRKTDQGRENYRIWATRAADDGWTRPERIDLGGEHSDLYPTFSPDGRALVFTSYRPTPAGGPPQSNLWYVPVAADGTLGDPVHLDELSDPQAYDAGPRFDDDGWLAWTSETWGPGARRVHRRARWTGSGFGVPEIDPATEMWREAFPGRFIWSVVESPDGEWAAIEASEVDADGRRGPSDLWLARRDGGVWGPPIPLGPEVSTPEAYENFAGFTPDSRALLFVRDFATYLRLPLASLEGGAER